MTTQEVDDLRQELADLKSLVGDILDAIYAAANYHREDSSLASSLRNELHWIVQIER